MEKEEDWCISRSNGGIKSEEIAVISKDGVVMSNVAPYGGDSVVSSKAVVIQTNSSKSPKSIKARFISNKKVLAMAIVYPNGDRVVIAREDDDDDKENQGFPRTSLQKRSAASNILKEQENQNPKVKAAAVESQAAEQLDILKEQENQNPKVKTAAVESQAAEQLDILKEQENQNPKVKAAAVESQAVEQLDMVASRLGSTLGEAYSWFSPLRRAFSWSPFPPDANTGAETSQEGLEMAAAPSETASSSSSSSSSLPSPGVKASHQNQK